MLIYLKTFQFCISSKLLISKFYQIFIEGFYPVCSTAQYLQANRGGLWFPQLIPIHVLLNVWLVFILITLYKRLRELLSKQVALFCEIMHCIDFKMALFLSFMKPFCLNKAMSLKKLGRATCLIKTYLFFHQESAHKNNTLFLCWHVFNTHKTWTII